MFHFVTNLFPISPFLHRFNPKVCASIHFPYKCIYIYLSLYVLYPSPSISPPGLCMSIFSVFFVPCLMLSLGAAVLSLVSFEMLTPELGSMALALSIGLAQWPGPGDGGVLGEPGGFPGTPRKMDVSIGEWGFHREFIGIWRWILYGISMGFPNRDLLG